MPLPMIIAITGIAAGVFSAILGVGGGIILVPVMVMLLGVPARVAVGTSLVVIVPTALTGVMRNYAVGNVNLKIGILLALGGIVGAYFGVMIGQHLPELVVKRAFAVVMVFMAYKMFTGR